MLPSKTIQSILCSPWIHFIFGSLILNPCRRHKAALNPITSDSDEPSPHVPAGPKKDYSLKEGQTFSISIPGRAKATTANSLLGSTTSAATSTSSTVPLLPPPPSSTKRRWDGFVMFSFPLPWFLQDHCCRGNICGGLLLKRWLLTHIFLNVIFEAKLYDACERFIPAWSDFIV